MQNTVEATRGKLSKQFLMDLDEGSYITSNCHVSKYQPVFAEKAAPMKGREDQWRRAVSVGADQRICYVFKTEDDYRAWAAAFWESDGDE